MFLTHSGEEPVVDRRRPIQVRVTPSDAPSPAAPGGWSDILMHPETTAVTLDDSDPTRMLHDLEQLARTVAQAPYRDHLRVLPIPDEITRRVAAHRWTDLPDRIGTGGLPVLCLTLAGRLVALPATDADFREVFVRFGDRGTVRIQSVGSTVIAMEVRRT
ncbi:hypothetical protein ACRAWC_08735 [Leifsonia sp. L25]